jgi:hypothetical protein
MQLQQFVFRCPLFFVFGFATGSCKPQGQWNRIIHPPHQAAVKNPGERETSKAEPWSQLGLPEACRDYRSSGFVCLECRIEVWLVQRCFPHQGHIEPHLHCRSTPDAVKCLAPEPIQALTLSLRRPEERVLAENYETWQATIRSIWSERLSRSEVDELEILLAFLQSLTSMLSEGRPEQWDRSLLLDLMKRDDAIYPPEERVLEQGWNRLHKLKLEGRLNLLTMLKQSQDLLSQLGVDERRLNYLNALTLEGLEEEK